jgi:hypothetical protein
MNKEDIYRAWAPNDSIWAKWVKPVLFSRMDVLAGESLAPPREPLNLEWAGRGDRGAGMVIDLPGEQGVHLALAAAERGFRPVPLYNGLPTPFGSQGLVDVHPIMRALAAGASQLVALRIPDHAPPAFMLDSTRGAPGKSARPLMYDNRSISLPGDFPSAQFLLTHGVRRMIVVVRTPHLPQLDLSRTLRAWQDGGIEILAKAMSGDALPVPLKIAKPFFLLPLWHFLVSHLGMQMHGGVFGGYVPKPSGG